MQTIQGVVQKGVGRGNALGFPTINLPLKASTLSGVYAGQVWVRGETSHIAVIFADPAREIVEAHLLDFQDSLYGLEVTIASREKIRDAKHYDSDDELKIAIAEDIAKVRKYFKN